MEADDKMTAGAAAINAETRKILADTDTLEAAIIIGSPVLQNTQYATAQAI